MQINIGDLSAYMSEYEKAGYSTKRRYYKNMTLIRTDIYTFSTRISGARPISGIPYRVTLPGGSLKIYTYSYPIDHTIHTTATTSAASSSTAYYDDTLDEKLGGEKETLG